MYGKMQESGFAEITCITCISATWGQYPEFLSAHLREQLQPNGCPMADIVLLPGSPQGSEIGGLELLLTVSSLFTNKAGNTSFLN